jgi:hypothetical protein
VPRDLSSPQDDQQWQGDAHRDEMVELGGRPPW